MASPEPRSATPARRAAPGGGRATGGELSRRQGSPTGSSTGTSAFGGASVSFADQNFTYGYYIDQMLSMIHAAVGLARPGRRGRGGGLLPHPPRRHDHRPAGRRLLRLQRLRPGRPAGRPAGGAVSPPAGQLPAGLAGGQTDSSIVETTRCSRAPTSRPAAALCCLLAALASPSRAAAEPQARTTRQPDIVVTLSGAQRAAGAPGDSRAPAPAARPAAEGAAAAREIESTLRADLDSSRIFVIQGAAELAVLELTGDDARDRELYRSLGNEVVLLHGPRSRRATGWSSKGGCSTWRAARRCSASATAASCRSPGASPTRWPTRSFCYFSQQPGIALSTISFVSDRRRPTSRRRST